MEYAIGIAALMVVLALDYLARKCNDPRRKCVCMDSDDCTCGGAWGARVIDNDHA